MTDEVHLRDELKAPHAHEGKKWVIYTVDEKPPFGEALFLGIQHYLTMFGATVAIPLILGGAMKMPQAEVGHLIAAIFLVSGITTWLQSTIGNRLPVIQGGSFSFLPPAFVIIGATVGKGMGYEIAVQQITGAIFLASFFEIILGYFGVVGYLKKYIGPVTIAPTIALIGLALFGIGAPWAGQNWWVSGVTLVALIIYSQLLGRKVRVFTLFPVLLAILTGWAFAWVLTFSGAIDAKNPAFINLANVTAAKWIDPPVPWRWGMWDFKVPFALAMIAAYVASMIESIGDYYAAARMAEAPIPDKGMISRGLGTEGVGCLIASCFQTCSGSTTYSENIGAIGLTRVGSRYVIQIGATVMIIIAFFGKFGAFFATIPTPVVGAMYCGLFGMIAAVGISNLQFVDLNSARNLFIIGFAFFMGLSVPEYFNKAFANSVIWEGTGWAWLGNVIVTIGKTGMAVAGILAGILDNIIPGTDEERGLTAWQ